MERIFLLNPKTGKWTECLNKALADSDVTKLPCTFILNEINSNTLYLSYPNSSSIYKILPDEICFRDELFAELECIQEPLGIKVLTKFVPMRWRIFQKDNGDFITISADIAEILTNMAIQIHWERFSYCVSQNHMVITDSLEKKRMYKMAPSITIPRTVLDTAMEMLQSETKKRTGIRPSLLSHMTGPKQIQAYMEYPFDTNLFYLKNFIGDNFYTLFPRGKTEYFTDLCKYLEIEKPPKSLRKAYTFCPYSVINYMILRQWRINDINLIRKFFEMDRCLGNFPADQYLFFKDEHTVGINRSNAKFAREWKELNYFIDWISSILGEKKFSNWLLTETKKDTDNLSADIFRMFYGNKDTISDELKSLILHEGLTRQVHDHLALETLGSDKNASDEKIFVDYPASILKYVCTIKNYQFHLIQNIKKLSSLGIIFSNCVNGYAWNVQHHESIIMFMTQGSRYVACIELDSTGQYIRQALGPYNRQLQGDDWDVLSEWAENFQLRIDQDNYPLNFNNPHHEEEFINPYENVPDILTQAEIDNLLRGRPIP